MACVAQLNLPSEVIGEATAVGAGGGARAVDERESIGADEGPATGPAIGSGADDEAVGTVKDGTKLASRACARCMMRLRLRSVDPTLKGSSGSGLLERDGLRSWL